MSLETNASLKEVVDKMEQIDADLQNKKQLIATAVTGKDVPTNGSDSFQKMADNIDSIKTKLPIMEGDVGVTEDYEGNVYNVKSFVNKRVYEEDPYTVIQRRSLSGTYGIKIYNDSKAIFSNSGIVMLDLDSMSSNRISINSTGFDTYNEEIFYVYNKNVYQINENGQVIATKDLGDTLVQIVIIKMVTYM